MFINVFDFIFNILGSIFIFIIIPVTILAAIIYIIFLFWWRHKFFKNRYIVRFIPHSFGNKIRFIFENKEYAQLFIELNKENVIDVREVKI
jgi:hypothetical protein